MPKIVYLDSSDFSDLSALESNLSSENHELLQIVRSNASNGQASFVLSGIHLSEAVHATNDLAHKEAAIRRARLMHELCSPKFFLRLPNEIMSLEIAKAVNGATDAKLSTNELFSKESEWFGISLELDFSQKRQKMMARFDEHISFLPRAERRKLRSDWKLSKASGRENWRKLADGHTEPLSNEFPFSLFNRQFIIEWITGHRSDEEFSKTLYSIMNNPLGLVESVLDLTEERHTIYTLLRSRGKEMQTRMDTRLQETGTRIYDLICAQPDINISKFFRNALPKARLCREIVSLHSDIEADGYSDQQITQIVAACPAVSAFLNMYVAYYFSRINSMLQRLKSGNKAPPSRNPSDFGDMMHAVYAPYCDFFRCDAFFSSLLKQDFDLRSRIVDRRQLAESCSVITA